MSKYDYEFEYDPVYCYPGSDILRNNMGIKDQGKLSKIERDVSFIKTTELMKNSSLRQFHDRTPLFDSCIFVRESLRLDGADTHGGHFQRSFIL